MRLCVSLSRGVAAPLGCVIFFTSVEIAACMPCAQGLSACARHGRYHYPRRALRAAETLDGRLSKAVNLPFPCVPHLHLRKTPQGTAIIRIDTDRLPLNLLRTNRLPLVDAGVGSVRVLRRHLPEGIFDNDRGIVFIAHHFLEAACRY